MPQDLVKPFGHTMKRASRLMGDTYGDIPSHVLFLHGGGVNSNRHSFDPIREFLLKRGITSCAFDFIGHGDTGGSIQKTNLSDRTDQALSIIRSNFLRTPLCIVAASMSGYTALRLLQSCTVNKLILVVPAVYMREAYRINFGTAFSNTIRQHRSWINSDAWEIIQKFTGELLIIFAEHDNVVPPDIVQKLYSSATHTTYKHTHLVPNSPHKILDFLYDRPATFYKVADLISTFLVSRSS